MNKYFTIKDRTILDFILYVSKKYDLYISHLKCMKICYLLELKYLNGNNKRLFDNNFIIGAHGVYHKFIYYHVEIFGSHNIYLDIDRYEEIKNIVENLNTDNNNYDCELIIKLKSYIGYIISLIESIKNTDIINISYYPDGSTFRKNLNNKGYYLTKEDELKDIEVCKSLWDLKPTLYNN